MTLPSKGMQRLWWQCRWLHCRPSLSALKYRSPAVICNLEPAAGQRYLFEDRGAFFRANLCRRRESGGRIEFLAELEDRGSRGCSRSKCAFPVEGPARRVFASRVSVVATEESKADQIQLRIIKMNK